MLGSPGRWAPHYVRAHGNIYVLAARAGVAELVDADRFQPVARARWRALAESLLRSDRNLARRLAWTCSFARVDESSLAAVVTELVTQLERGSLCLLVAEQRPRVDGSIRITPELEPYAPPPAAPAPVPIIDKSLLITACDDHFAPGVEQLCVVYLLRSLAEHRVEVEITSDNYPGRTVYKRELEAHEKRDGAHVLRWDGRPDGADEGEYVTPLHAPFTVEIKHDAVYRDTAEFKILYHSLRIVSAPWTPDGQAPPESAGAAWVQYRLNELGYFAGPVGADVDDYLARAIVRYKLAHPAFAADEFADYDDAIDDTLEQALRAGDNPRRWINGAAWSSPRATSEIVVGGLLDHHGQPQAGVSERDWLNRPLIPLEAQVLLRSKTDAPALSPAAVGPVRTAWSFTHDDPDATADGYDQPWLLGDEFVPFTAEPDAGRECVLVEVWTDADEHGARRGRAGILFRPSPVNANDYRLRATLDFSNQPNAAQLDELHAITDADSQIHAQTGEFVIVWPTVELALRLADERDRPYASCRYELDVGGETRSGTTDARGRLRHMIASEVREVTLRLWPNPRDDQDTFTWTIAVGRLDPLASDTDVAGAQARLENLGFFAGEISGELDEATRAALSDFQRLLGHDPPSGELDEATRAALTDRHQR